jgi:hypothetical protein
MKCVMKKIGLDIVLFALATVVAVACCAVATAPPPAAPTWDGGAAAARDGAVGEATPAAPVACVADADTDDSAPIADAGHAFHAPACAPSADVQAFCRKQLGM